MISPTMYLPRDLLNKYQNKKPKLLGYCTVCGRDLYKNGDGIIECINCEHRPEEEAAAAAAAAKRQAEKGRQLGCLI